MFDLGMSPARLSRSGGDLLFRNGHSNSSGESGPTVERGDWFPTEGKAIMV